MMLAMVSYWPVGLSAAYGLAFVLGWGEVGLGGVWFRDSDVLRFS